ncbi:MAG: cytochrome-c oxidase, cbb3-type subunit III [Gammaproteobacteria bacterium]|nr:MAG: cytochrome-c oxidase, cbb3-type subunit III [Gammaproteobacteria bacterium]
MSAFWQGWITVLTVLNILACFWLIRWTIKKRAGEAAQGEVTGHVWDETLEEYNNPLPRWWLYLFYGTLIFAAVYLTLYPGIWKGVLGWSSHGSQYEAEMAKAKAKYDPIYQQYAKVPVAALATKPEYKEAREMGKRLFLTYCMQCHQSDASGARGFPNLTDNDWLYGGKPEDIVKTIADGRTSIGMPAHAQLGDEKVHKLAQYVLSLSGRASDKAAAEEGKNLFMTVGCAGCHGPDAKGNPALGAPNLTDNIWLYGGSPKTIEKTIRDGRKGVMPAHKKLLGEEKIHLLAAYVYSLSHK